MNTRLASRMLAAALACSPVAIHDCYAARIYNNLDQPINVASTVNGGVQIPAKSVSPSLNWSSSQGLDVFELGSVVGGRTCSLSFGFHAQIQGGNYMIVSQTPQGVDCAGDSCGAAHSHS